MAAPTKRVVGWYDRLEWVRVYEELYSSDPTKQKHAVDRIAVWKSRAPNKLSTAIECTWELVTAELQYEWVKDESSLAEQDRSLRIMYAMALTRFINLITEKGQNTRYAQPVHHLANELCLPKWMVSLRHDAVHSNLPALTILRTGVQSALSWLKEEYWEAQLAEDDPDLGQLLRRTSDVPDSDAAEMMTQMLEAYTSLYHTLYSESTRHKLTNSDWEQLKPILRDIEQLINNCSLEVALKVLLQDGFMIHSADQLHALNISTKDLMTGDNLQLPPELIVLWLPVLRIVRRQRALIQFLCLLLAQSEDQSALHLRQAAGWVFELLQALNAEGQGTENVNKSLLNLLTDDDREYMLTGRRLLLAGLEHPNTYTTQILPHLFKSVTPALSPLQEKLLTKTVKLYIENTGVSSSMEDDTQVYSIENLNIVERNIHWDHCPLGHCPDIPVTYTNLELPECVNNLRVTGTQISVTRPPSTPGRTKKPQLGKRSPRSKSGNDYEPASKISVQWSPSEMNRIKDQIVLF